MKSTLSYVEFNDKNAGMLAFAVHGMGEKL